LQSVHDKCGTARVGQALVVLGRCRCGIGRNRSGSAGAVDSPGCRPGRGRTAGSFGGEILSHREEILPASAPTWRIELLGSLRVWHGPQPVDLGPMKQRALFAVLALNAEECV